MDFSSTPNISVTPAGGNASALDDLNGLFGASPNGLAMHGQSMAPPQNFDLDGLLNRPPSPTPNNPLPPTQTMSASQSANSAQYNAQFNQVASVMATTGYPYHHQPGVMGGQPGVMGGQPGVVGGQTGIMGGQPGIVGGQPGIVGGQAGIVGGQAGMVGGQPGIVGGQAGMVGGQAGMVGGQAGMVGGQAGMVGGQAGMVGGQSGMMGGQPGMMGGQSGMLGGVMPGQGVQGGMMGGQGGMMGGQGGMMAGQGGMMANPGVMMANQSGMMPGQTGMAGGQSFMMGAPPNQLGGGIATMGDPRLSAPSRAAPNVPRANLAQPFGMGLPHAPPQSSSVGAAHSLPLSMAPAPPVFDSIAPVHDSLILSPSFTEPGPIMSDQDPLADILGSPSANHEVTEAPEASATFYIDETDAGDMAVEEAVTEEKAEEKEGEKKEEEKEPEAAPPQRKGFFSLFSRSKEGGSQEQILDEKEKEPKEKEPKEKEPEPEKGRGGNEQKFLGDGQTFKGKLIGVLEVREARGDRMCQDALQELKMAIKASGEHKQKVNIQIAVDGLKIRDEKSGDCLYHHPVHKISFIAQDMTDNRAFGYIYGSPENGHRFFGIKSEKAAGQVVVAMRDLFQVVFELKKKEIDEAKQNIEKIGVASGESKQEPVTSQPSTSAATFPDGPAPSTTTSNAIDDLLGLENEISAIQAGIQQIDKITPNAPMSFQTDSMLPLHIKMPEAATLPQSQSQPVTTKPRPVAVMNNGQNKSDMFGAAPFLPPPPKSAVRRQEGDRYAVFDAMQPRPNQPTQAAPNSGSFNILQGGSQPQSFTSVGSDGRAGDLVAAEGGVARPADPPVQGLLHNSSSNFQTSAMAPQQGGFNSNHDLASLFTDLDPLGSGKAKPFVDKKDFFSDSKTSPKMNSVPQDTHMTSSAMSENPIGGGLL